MNNSSVYYDENGRRIIRPTYDLRTGLPSEGGYEQRSMSYGASMEYQSQIDFNVPQDEETRRKAEVANIEIQKKYELNRQEIMKKATLDEIRTAGERKRAETRADVASRAALHNEAVVICRDGRVTVKKEGFNGYIEKIAPFLVYGEAFVYFCGKAEGRILFATITLANGRQADFYISLASLTANRINEAFNRIGVSFEMGKKKERELREKFMNALVACAILEELPYCDDWYRTDSGWQYVSSSEKTWLEVLKNVK